MRISTRAAGIVAAVLIASILLSTSALAVAFEDFSDAQGHWAEPYLRRAVDEGLLTGTSPTTLEPGAPADLPQALTILCRLLGPQKRVETPELGEHWYNEYVERALSLDVGIDFDLLTHGQFTRAQAFELLAEAFRLVPADPDMSVLDSFTDTALMTYSERAAAAALVGAGYVNGSGEQLMPSRTVNRAELLTMFLRIAEYTVSGKSAPDSVSGGTVFTDTGDLAGKKYLSTVWIGANVDSVDLSGLRAGTVVVLAEDADVKVDGATNIMRLVLAGGKSQDVTFGTGRIGTLVISPGAPDTVRVGAGVDNVEVTAGGKTVYITDDLGEVRVSGSGNKVNINASTKLVETAEGSSDNTVTIGYSTRELNIYGGGNRVTLNSKAIEARLGGSGCALEGYGTAKRLYLFSRRSTSSIGHEELRESYPEGLGELEMDITAPRFVNAGDSVAASVLVKDPEAREVTLTWALDGNEIKTEKLTASKDGATANADLPLPLVDGMSANAYVTVTASYGEESASTFALVAVDGLDKVMDGGKLIIRNNGSSRGGNVKVAADITSKIPMKATLTWYEGGTQISSGSVNVGPEKVTVYYNRPPTVVDTDGNCAVKAVLSFTGGGKTSSMTYETVVEAGVTPAQALETVTCDYAGDYTLEWALEHDYTDNMKTVWVNAMDFDSDTEYLIWVNRTYQRVNIFTGSNGNWKLDRVFLCGTGKRGSSTPVGQYTVWAFQTGWHHATYWCEPVVRFYTGSGYAFHSRLWKPGHKTLQDDRIGFPISAGCVRMYDEDIQWMYDNIPMNTKVVVY